MNAWKLIALAAVVLVAGGCADLKAPFPRAEPPAPAAKKQPEPPPEPLATTLKRQVSDVESLIGFYEHVRRLSSVEQAKDFEALRQVYNRDKSDLNRLKLALIQAMPNSPVRNDAAAQALIDPMLKDGEGHDAGLKAFAQLLNAHLAERKRLEDRLREDQKEIEELQKKLDALKSIEKSLIDRGRPPAVPTPVPATAPNQKK